MKKIRDLIIKYKELILYVFFGGLTTLVNFAAFKFFNVVLGEERYLISNVIAWFVSVVFAYITNKLFVFESRTWQTKKICKEIFSFFTARVFSFIIEEAGLFCLVDLMGFDKYRLDIFGFVLGGKMISKIILAVIVVILNYFFSKLVVFRKKEKQ
ncbi:MAG: GtrA family protein [Clostridia bacterium]|nr:GtrA family protein [Clostridia bacterium]